jgi:hypothetical protein
MAKKTKPVVRNSRNHTTDKVYKLKSRKTTRRPICEPRQTISKDFNLSKVGNADSATKEKEEMSKKGRPSIRQRSWVYPFILKSFLLLLLFIPLLVIPLSPAASSMERVNGVTFPPILPERNYFEANQRLVQHLTDILWTRWQREYLQTLQKRSNWNMPQSSLAVGDIVLLMD